MCELGLHGSVFALRVWASCVGISLHQSVRKSIFLCEPHCHLKKLNAFVMQLNMLG